MQGPLRIFVAANAPHDPVTNNKPTKQSFTELKSNTHRTCRMPRSWVAGKACGSSSGDELEVWLALACEPSCPTVNAKPLVPHLHSRGFTLGLSNHLQ
jgi:hypothetical protein